MARAPRKAKAEAPEFFVVLPGTMLDTRKHKTIAEAEAQAILMLDGGGTRPGGQRQSKVFIAKIIGEAAPPRPVFTYHE